jgi:ribonucleoside-diphosphate reductase alpha chain
MEVGAWVYKNFDICSGISFLPHSDHTYAQAPYQDITEEEYNDLKKQMPTKIDWSALSLYEKKDTTNSSQTLACTADGCEIVDI